MFTKRAFFPKNVKNVIKSSYACFLFNNHDSSPQNLSLLHSYLKIFSKKRAGILVAENETKCLSKPYCNPM